MNDELPLSISFPPIANEDARILILGSMPGVKSLEQQQYYAHPRNAFWPIISELFGINKNLEYQLRCKYLIENQVAVWDVLKACQRKGSLDKHIDPVTIIANDFNSFFEQHSTIQQIFFNGTKAEQFFTQHVLPALDYSVTHISRQRLPSTSPAHAAMGYKQKLHVWKHALTQ
jgi:double-stranded uracil-DNA glycosylase